MIICVVCGVVCFVVISCFLKQKKRIEASGT